MYNINIQASIGVYTRNRLVIFHSERRRVPCTLYMCKAGKERGGFQWFKNKSAFPKEAALLPTGAVGFKGTKNVEILCSL